MLQNLFAFSNVMLCFHVRYKFLFANLMEQEIKTNVAIWVANDFIAFNLLLHKVRVKIYQVGTIDTSKLCWVQLLTSAIKVLCNLHYRIARKCEGQIKWVTTNMIG